MKVWVVTAGYRGDYEILGVYAREDLATARLAAYDEGWGEYLNESKRGIKTEVEVQGLPETVSDGY